MSSTSSSPADFQPLHHPEARAVVAAPPDDKAANVPGLGAGQRALLAQKMKATSASFVSPTDNLMTPVTAKLANAKKKNFTKGKPLQLANSLNRFASHTPVESPQAPSKSASAGGSNPFEVSEGEEQNKRAPSGPTVEMEL